MKIKNDKKAGHEHALLFCKEDSKQKGRGENAMMKKGDDAILHPPPMRIYA